MPISTLISSTLATTPSAVVSALSTRTALPTTSSVAPALTDTSSSTDSGIPVVPIAVAVTAGSVALVAAYLLYRRYQRKSTTMAHLVAPKVATADTLPMVANPLHSAAQRTPEEGFGFGALQESSTDNWQGYDTASPSGGISFWPPHYDSGSQPNYASAHEGSPAWSVAYDTGAANVYNNPSVYVKSGHHYEYEEEEHARGLSFTP